MSTLLTPNKTEQGWVVTMSPEMARAAGVAEGSLIVLYLKEGSVSAEILPPPTEEMQRSVQESIDKFADAFAEMKRLGD
jgi:hypothetical protein